MGDTLRYSKDIVKRRGQDRARRGRPRSAELDAAILGAALRLMARQGYARMSIDALAEEAGVTKPSIYLRFPDGKAEVATTALARARDQRPVPETGDTRRDLLAHLRSFGAGLMRPFGMSMIGTVLAEEHLTPGLLALFRTHIVRPRRAMLRAVLERARARGELRPGADVKAAINMMVGAYYARYLAGDPVGAEWAEHIVDVALDGIARE